MADTRNNERRLLDLLAKSHPHGMTSTDLADKLEITSETARQMIYRLREYGYAIEDNDAKGRATRYLLAPQKYMQNIKLTQAQSWMLYLSIRRIVRSQQHRFPIVKTLIQQLTLALHPHLSQKMDIEPTNIEADDVFKQVVEAWQNHRWMTIYYRPLNKTTPHEWRIAPLWFEPAIWSDSNYVICDVQIGNEIRGMTLKLDRIEKILLLSGDKFAPPDIENILNQIEDTWGIWLGEGAPVQVVLHFDQRVLDRLRETRWHPTQQLIPLDNGKIQWTALISEPREMLSWIRGWGADVEVIEPQFLRDEIGAEAERMARMYGRMNTQRKGFI